MREKSLYCVTHLSNVITIFIESMREGPPYCLAEGGSFCFQRISYATKEVLPTFDNFVRVGTDLEGGD